MISAFVMLSLAAAQADDATHRLLHDWGGLTRYGSENTEIRPPRPGENRVVMIGDDLTERWGQGSEPFFPGKPYFNRGISGQTSPQMLVRFRQDVISLRPKVVIIQAGANDLAGRTGPATQPMIAEQIMSMADLGRANGIRVVLASLTPVCDCTVRQTAKRPVGKIMGVNEWLRDYARETGAVYLDLYSPLVEGRALRQDLTTDGFLLNDAAYKILAPPVERAVSSALEKK